MSIRPVTRSLALSFRTAVCALFGGLALAPAVASAAPACGAPVDTGSRMQVYCSFTGGEQEFVVPAGVASLRVSASGATGGGAVANMYYGGTNPGAVGATAAGDVAVTPGSTLYINVGGAGWTGGGGFNGGGGAGSNRAGGGGGASDIRTCAVVTCSGMGTVWDPRLVVGAGGGGCGAYCMAYQGSGRGGEGGLPSPGTDGAGDFNYSYGSAGGGLGATQTAGGAGGRGYSNPQLYNGPSAPGTAGTAERGGDGGVGAAAGAGGGSGYFGGGGGGGNSDPQVPSSDGGGGGGGSSYTGTATGTNYGAAPRGNGSVVITYIPAPTCPAASASTAHDTATSITLACSNYDSTPATYAIVSAPAHGTTSGLDPAAGTLSYTPTAGYTGTDAFTYTATNSVGVSNTATVTVTVTPPPAPSCSGVTVTTAFQTATPVTLDCTAPSAYPRTFAIVAGPSDGSVSSLDASAGTLSYTPGPDFAGSDSFSYRATNAGGASNTATVAISVTPPPPVCQDVAAAGRSGAGRPVTLDCTRPYGFAVTHETLSAPTHGTISALDAQAGTLTYTADAAYVGTDSFTYRAQNSGGASATKTVTLTVPPPAPACSAVAVTTAFQTAAQVTLDCTAPSDYARTFAVVAGPSHGAVSSLDAAQGTLTYTPVDAFAGTDSFTYRATNSGGPADTATVTITVTPPPPVCQDVVAAARGATGRSVALDCTRPYGFSVTHEVLSPPAHGAITAVDEQAGTLTYTADTGYDGTDTFTYRAGNTGGPSGTRTVTMSVDSTDPAITITSPADGATFARHEIVAAAFSCADEAGGAGLASCVGTVPSGSPIDTATAGGHAFVVSAVDSVGNSRDTTVHYTVSDTVDPTLSITSPVDGATYDRHDLIAARYSCDDEPGGSGLATCSGDVPDGSAIDTDEAGPHSFTVTAVDVAGNTHAETVHYRVHDTTAPTITIATPDAGASYGRGRTIAASYACADEAGGSGIASCVGTVPHGDAIDTATLGAHTFTVTAIDGDGNTHSASATYTVRDVTRPTLSITNPVDDANYDQGSDAGRVTFACADEAGGSGLDACDGSLLDATPIDTSRIGRFAITVTASDVAGNATSETIHYSVGDVRKPAISVGAPAAGAVLAYGSDAPVRFACDDGEDGTGIAACVASEERLETRTPGEHRLVLMATDGAGNTTWKAIGYRVLRAPVELAALTVAPRTFTPRGRRGPVRSGTPRTAEIGYDLSRDAAFAVTLTRLNDSGAVAARPSRSTTIRAALARRDRFAFDGRRDGRPLPAGRWRVSIVATDSDGNVAGRRSVEVRVR